MTLSFKEKEIQKVCGGEQNAQAVNIASDDEEREGKR